MLQLLKIFSKTAREVLLLKVALLEKFVTHCEFCGTQFKEEHQHKMHWKKLEEKFRLSVTKYPCALCERVFYVERNYDRHPQLLCTKRSFQYKHLWTECGKSLWNWSIITDNIIIDQGKEFNVICNKLFLRTSVKIIH